MLSLSLSRFFPLFALLARPRKASKPQKPPKKRKTKNSPAPRSALSSPSRATRSPCTTRGRSRMAPSSTRRSTGEKGRKKEREGERGGRERGRLKERAEEFSTERAKKPARLLTCSLLFFSFFSPPSLSFSPSLSSILFHSTPRIGWDAGLNSMCVGEKRKLKIPSDMGYG